MKNYLIILMLALTRLHNVFAQGFVNLDFENANLTGYSTGSVPATNAIPGWTAYLGGIAQANINYNTDLAGVQIDLFGSTNIQGEYFISLNGTSSQAASIGQTGTIPLTAQSLIWWGSKPNILSFDDQQLPIILLGFGVGYDIYGADISAFAGETGQLIFSSNQFPVAFGAIIDNIQFSSSPVPEPSAFGLLGMGGLLLAGSLFHRKARRSH